MTPAQPPALIQPTFAPLGAAIPRCAATQKPIASRISVISSVRKTAKTAPFTRVLQKSMYVLKIANENKNHASPFAAGVLPVSAVPSFVLSKNTTVIPSASQNPPYVENAVAPKTFRLRNSHIPASNCTSPP
jgi:hypothetical protein